MVKRVFKLVYSEIRSLHQAAYILALFAIGSQMLALVRDRLLAHTFGAGSELDLYYAAFRIPDLLFALFASILSVYVLLPFVTKARAEKSEASAASILSQMLTVFLVVYVLMAGVLFVMTPYLVHWLFPGFADNADVLVMLIRVLLLQPFLLGVSSLFGVVTQLSQRFVLYALSPLVYNLGIIFGIVVLYPQLGILGLAIGVVLGALGHILIQVPLVNKSELAFGFVKKIDWHLIRSILLFSFPRAVTLSIHQVVLLVFISLATLMTAGSVSAFQLAFNLQSVPLAIIGMSYSVAAFPVLADLFAKQKRDEFCHHVLSAVRHIIFWSFPIIALVIVLRAQIVRVLLGSGEFSWNDTRLTAAMLALFVISLVGQSLLLLLVRTFYAGGNTRTPLLIALFGAVVSITSALLMVMLFKAVPVIRETLEGLFRLSGVVGTEVLILAIAFIIGIMVEMILLLIFTRRQFGLVWSSLNRQLFEATFAALAAGTTAYATLSFIVDGIKQEVFLGILLQGVVAGILGITASLLVYYSFKSKELHEIYSSFRIKILKKDLIAPQVETP
jgi:putative peptidoglycan lipid II flippase